VSAWYTEGSICARGINSSHATESVVGRDAAKERWDLEPWREHKAFFPPRGERAGCGRQAGGLHGVEAGVSRGGGKGQEA
jgi:hypothetical protein